MGKSDYAEKLYDAIKDEVKCDSDILALESLLEIIIEEDIEKSFERWKYVILKYDFLELLDDVDFTPIMRNFPTIFLEKVGVTTFFSYMSNISIDKAQVIYSYIFDIYDRDSYLNLSLITYIESNNFLNEEKFIYSILDRSESFFVGFFDITEFIRNIIMKHIEYKSMPYSLIKKLVDMLDNKKDKAVLKTLLIDYFEF